MMFYGGIEYEVIMGQEYHDSWVLLGWELMPAEEKIVDSCPIWFGHVPHLKEYIK